ncbi:MAG: tol-pal system-associated acyl-CoA thioesterase [Pseudomonadota bacterium]
MIHSWPIRVYYEDTDLAGLVYYANYLKFIERARSEMVREAGIDQLSMKATGLVFAVRRLVAEYLKPAHYDDQLTVETRLNTLKRARFYMDQVVCRDGMTLFSAQVEIVCLDPAGKPKPLPMDIRQKIAGLVPPTSP